MFEGKPLKVHQFTTDRDLIRLASGNKGAKNASSLAEMHIQLHKVEQKTATSDRYDVAVHNTTHIFPREAAPIYRTFII